LDVSSCGVLTELNCSNNQLTSLDLSGSMSLTNVDCRDNPLITSLDLSSHSKLTLLDCTGNVPLGGALSQLDVSGCSSLLTLRCFGNQLTSLDVSDCVELTELTCDYNRITSLDVSNCLELGYLCCGPNQLSTLDISHNLWIENLVCWGNPLTDVILGWSVPPVSSQLIYDFSSIAASVLHVPIGSISAYLSAADRWRDCKAIVEVSPPDPPVPPVDPAPVDPAPIDPPVPPVDPIDPDPIDPIAPVDPNPVAPVDPDPIVPDDPSSIESIPSSSIKLSLTSVLLSVSSPYSERITIYSSSGILLIRASKEKGSTSITVSHLPRGVLIVRGSSGWSRKIIRQ
jgi:Leucine-rich repeat (LRR) protein